MNKTGWQEVGRQAQDTYTRASRQQLLQRRREEHGVVIRVRDRERHGALRGEGLREAEPAGAREHGDCGAFDGALQSDASHAVFNTNTFGCSEGSRRCWRLLTTPRTRRQSSLLTKLFNNNLKRTSWLRTNRTPPASAALQRLP